MRAGGGVLDRPLDEHHREPGQPPVALPAQDPAHAPDHLSPGTAGPDDDRQVGGRDIDPLVEYPGSAHGGEGARREAMQDVTAQPRGKAGVEDAGLDASSGESASDLLARRGRIRDLG